MIISNTCLVSANENLNFYTLSINTESYDAYVYEKIGSFLYGHYGEINESLKVGKGISIINENDFSKLLYPVWNGNKIEGTFIVVNVEDEFSGTYSKMYVEQLNDLIPLTSVDDPLKLIADNGFYAMIGNNVYDMNQSLTLVEKENLQSYSFDNYIINNSFEKINHVNPIIPRYPTTKYLSWARYTSLQPAYDESDGYCAAYCLYNIFRNKGIADHTFANVKSGVPNYGDTFNYLKSYLTSKGYSYFSKKVVI